MFSAMLVLFGDMEAGCFREMADLYSDHYRLVPLYHGSGRCIQHETCRLGSVLYTLKLLIQNNYCIKSVH